MLHFLVDQNILKLILPAVDSALLKLRLKQKVLSVKVLSIDLCVLLFTTNAFMPFREAMDTNLRSGAGPKSKHKALQF